MQVSVYRYNNKDLKQLIGAFGEVRMCIHRESGAQKAVKVIVKSEMSEKESRMLFNEINVLKEIVSIILLKTWLLEDEVVKSLVVRRITQTFLSCTSFLRMINAII